MPVALLMALASCANIVAPSGGPFDRESPKFVRSAPAPRAPLFSENKLVITFHEFVNLNDAANQVVVSPPLKEIPEFRTRGKSVIVTFREKLRNNTTYTVNFGNSIRDITENNETADFRFSFSTGMYVDSLTLTGFVRNAYKTDAEKDILVMLYQKSYDSIPYKEKPDHITKSDASGKFIFGNLPPGDYMIFALRDANANLLFDLPTEAIAFANENATPTYIPPPDTSSRADSLKADTIHAHPVKPLELRLFEEADTMQRLLKDRADLPGQFQIIFRQPAKSINLRFLKNKPAENWNLMEYNPGRDTLTCWVTDLNTDSVFAEVMQGNVILDTIQIDLKSPTDSVKTQRGRGSKGAGSRSQGFRLILNPNTGSDARLDIYKPLVIHFSHPVRESDFTQMVITEKADSTGRVIAPLIFFSDTGINRKLLLEYGWKKNMKYELFIPPKCFTDIFGLANDTLRVHFTTTSAEDYGIFKLNIGGLSTSQRYILHLLDDKGNTLKEKVFDGTDTLHVFDYLKPATYRARLITDENRNGRWDSGRYLIKQQPEKVFYPASPATIRANWDTEIDWDIHE